MNKPFRTWILWGSMPEDGQEPFEYAFETQAELDAFLQGVEEAEGWMRYELADGPGYRYREKYGELMTDEQFTTEEAEEAAEEADDVPQ